MKILLALLMIVAGIIGLFWYVNKLAEIDAKKIINKLSEQFKEEITL